MYRTTVAARIRVVWRRIDAHDADAAWAMATDDMAFHFAGDTGLSVTFTGWGKMTDDWVPEDTVRFEHALAVQDRSPASST